MTANEIRQSFLDFFREKSHSIVPSASLMPTSPNLLFTNAGMNQFVPYFLGSEKAPYDPPRAADTQKCIRAGGKHNDLEDVGYDTYHHTFFEMLGNWSFGDYFKAEAIHWSWELIVERWGFPPERLYATVYAPGEGDPATFDQEAYDHWKDLFQKAGLDPDVHIVNGNVKDNFWAMGDTGPCGPCSELHVDLTPKGDTRGALVNKDDARCIEIWNLVFIQFNRDEDGTYRSLPAKHVDTGMGFERACSILQGTKGFSDFSKLPSNYDTDVFEPLFAKLSDLTGKNYTATLPSGRENLSEQEQIDVAFRVIGDHVRTLSFSIADGILPGNKGRNYVLRGILRRAVRFGRQLGLSSGTSFLPALAPVLIEQFGHAFPELKEHRGLILETLSAEEELFNRTLDRGLKFFDSAAAEASGGSFPAPTVVKLWETYGFPLDLTELMLQERGLTTDTDEVEKLIQHHRETGAEGQGSEVVSAVDVETGAESEFVGFEADVVDAKILELLERDGEWIAVVDRSPLYVEKGGQVGDTGVLGIGDEEIPIVQTFSAGDALCLRLGRAPKNKRLRKVSIQVDSSRRRDIERHHTATHLLHWALHEEIGPEATQQGSLVAPDRLRFDFNSKALDRDQLASLERRINERIAAADPVSWVERPYAEIKENRGVLQFFGDKYGDEVRVVQIGGSPGELDGYSMELCGGTHVRDTGQIGLCAISSEGAVAAGIRRIEARCGQHARDHYRENFDQLHDDISKLTEEAGQLASQLEGEIVEAPEIELPVEQECEASHIEDLIECLGHLRSTRDALKDRVLELKKSLQKREAKHKAAQADAVLAELIESAGAPGDSIPVIAHHLGDGDGGLLQEALNGLKKRQFPGVAVLTAVEGDKVHLGIAVAPEQTAHVKAGDLMKELAPIIGGRGGGKPELARGAGTDPSQIEQLLDEARRLANV